MMAQQQQQSGRNPRQWRSKGRSRALDDTDHALHRAMYRRERTRQSALQRDSSISAAFHPPNEIYITLESCDTLQSSIAEISFSDDASVASSSSELSSLLCEDPSDFFPTTIDMPLRTIKRNSIGNSYSRRRQRRHQIMLIDQQQSLDEDIDSTHDDDNSNDNEDDNNEDEDSAQSRSISKRSPFLQRSSILLRPSSSANNLHMLCRGVSISSHSRTRFECLSKDSSPFLPQRTTTRPHTMHERNLDHSCRTRDTPPSMPSRNDVCTKSTATPTTVSSEDCFAAHRRSVCS